MFKLIFIAKHIDHLRAKLPKSRFSHSDEVFEIILIGSQWCMVPIELGLGFFVVRAYVLGHTLGFFFKFLKKKKDFFFGFFCEYFSFLLKWDPMGAKISTRYSVF